MVSVSKPESRIIAAPTSSKCSRRCSAGSRRALTLSNGATVSVIENRSYPSAIISVDGSKVNCAKLETQQPIFTEMEIALTVPRVTLSVGCARSHYRYESSCEVSYLHRVSICGRRLARRLNSNLALFHADKRG